MDAVFHQLFDPSPNKGDTKRFEILKAALSCIARDGFEGGTFAKIAKKLETRRSHVAYYYKDRHELFEQVIRYIIGTAQAITIEMVRAHSTPTEQIIAIGDAAFEWAARHPEQAKVLMFFHFECASRARYRKLNAQIREAGTARIQALLTQVLGEKKEKTEIADLARTLQAIMSGFAIDSILNLESQPGAFRALSARACRKSIEQELQSA